MHEGEQSWPFPSDEPRTPARASGAATSTSSRCRSSIARRLQRSRCCRTASAPTAAIYQGREVVAVEEEK